MNNLSVWDSLKQPPPDALKQIKAGRLKGMTDVNPQWRYQAMTEKFGPCGVGWKYTVDKTWREDGADGQVFAFAQVSLYLCLDKRWSEPIPGVGGSMLVSKERAGLHTSDEGYKMAITDALSVAMKMVGVAADIYAGRWDGSKYRGPVNGSGNGFISKAQIKIISQLVKETKSDNPNFYKAAKAETINTIPQSEFDRIYALLMDKKARMELGPGADG